MPKTIQLKDKDGNVFPKLNINRYEFSGSYVTTGNDSRSISVNIPKAGLYIVEFSYNFNQGGYMDNVIDLYMSNHHISHDIRQTWTVGASMTVVIPLNAGIQNIASVYLWRANTVYWKANLTYLNKI